MNKIISTWWEFALWNILVILIASIIYFLLKEFYRVKSGRISNITIVFSGTLIGILLLVTYLFVDYTYSISINSKSMADWSLNNDHLHLETILQPSMIFLLIYGIYVDKRLVFPISFFLFIGYIIRFPKHQTLNDFSVWLQFVFSFINLIVLSSLIYFTESAGLIKNNGSRLLFIFLMWMILLMIFRISFQISFTPPTANGAIIGQVSQIIAVEIAYLSIFMFVQGEIIFFISRIYANFNKMVAFSTQDDISYYRISLSQNKLNELIDEKKITIGALIMFDIKSDANIKSKILDKIRNETKNTYKETFFFRASSNYYGAFYSLPENLELNPIIKNNKLEKRTKDDSLKPLADIFSKIEIESEKNVKINSVCSIYGIHSNDINELIDLNKFLMSPIVNRSNSNNIVVYDFKRIKSRLKERNNVGDLFHGIEDISIDFSRGVSSENIYYPIISFKKNKDKYLTKIVEKNKNEKDNELLFRYSAYQSLRKFKKDSSLIIYYSSMTLERSKFNIEDFVKKIERYLPINKVIIGVSICKNIKNKKTFEKNIKNLEKKGFRFALVNPMDVTQESHDILMPKYLLDVEEDEKVLKIKEKKLKIKTQAIRLNTYLV